MDRLSLFLGLAVSAVTSGGLIIVVLSLGYYAPIPIFGAAILGILIAWPLSFWISRLVKRNDPNWNRTASASDMVPKPGAPEV